MKQIENKSIKEVLQDICKEINKTLLLIDFRTQQLLFLKNDLEALMVRIEDRERISESDQQQSR